jgi:hypothetical protein
MPFFTIQRKKNFDSFFTKVAQRRAEFARVKQISGRICVPPELQYWYWQEFGTAVGGTNRVTPDPVGGASGSTYPIAPVNTNMLKFPWKGEDYYTSLVKNHPGVPPHHSVTKQLKVIKDLAIINLELASLAEGFLSVEGIMDSLLLKTLPQAINLISRQMEQDLTGTRPEGRLGGQSAASDFNTKAFVKDTTS